MLVDEIGTRLAAQSVGTVGTNIFLGQMPDTPDTCIAIMVYPGRSPILTLGHGVQAERPRFQILSRSSTFTTAQNNIHKAFNALHFGQLTISSVRYLSCDAVQSPFELRRDENQRIVWACNFEACKELSATS